MHWTVWVRLKPILSLINWLHLDIDWIATEMRPLSNETFVVSDDKVVHILILFLGVKTPLQIAMVVCLSVGLSVCLSTILKCPPKSLKLATSSNIYHKVAPDDNR